MGVAYYITLERDIDGFDSMVDGKALNAASGPLESIARQLKVRVLDEFVSAGIDDVQNLLGEDADVPELPPKSWHDAKEGLATIRALLGHLQRSPQDLKQADRVVADLKDFERVLARAEQEGVRWHLSVDF